MSCGIVRFLHPPTAVHNAVYCNFFNKREKSLVVAGLNFIQVYRVNVIPTQQLSDSSDSAPKALFDDDDEDDLYTVRKPVLSAVTANFSPENVRLECLATFEVFGTVTDLKASALPHSNRDLLLLAFADAKLSAVQYDPIINDLRSISLHDYEAARFSDEMPTNLGPAEPIVRVDPDNRCAVMRLYRTQLLVIPFVHPPNRTDNALNGPKPVSQFRSFALSLKKIKDDPNEFIQDFQLLPGYLEPTVAVLCHRVLSWPGRVAINSDTCYVAALSLNTRERAFHLIWNCVGLPYDSKYMLSVPRPIGGLLVVSTSAMIYVNQGVPAMGISLNSTTAGSTRFPLRPEAAVVATLDGSSCAFFESERLLLTLRNGNGFVVTIIYDHAMRTVREFHWQQVLNNRYASCITPLEGGYIFVGGRLSDSVLYMLTSSEWIEAEAALVEDDGNDDFAARRAGPRKTLLTITDDEDIYGPNAFVSVVTPLKKYHFTACDELISLGPCRTSAVGEPLNSAEDFVRSSDKDADLVTCSGYENESHVVAMHKSIRPDVLASFDIQDVQDLWTLQDDSSNDHSLVVISTSDKTSVFHSVDEIVEAEEHPFQGDEPTIFCCQLHNGRISVQVTRTYARVVTLTGCETVDFTLEGNDEVKFATALNERFVFVTTGGMLMLYEWDSTLGIITEVNTSALNLPENGILAASLYVDYSGLFTTTVPSNVGTIEMVIEPDVLDTTVKAEPQPEDEDKLLYETRGSQVDQGKEKFGLSPEEFRSSLMELRTRNLPFGPTDWLLLVRRDHTLTIYSLPDLILMFETYPMIHAPRVIHDVCALEQPSAPPNAIASACQDQKLKEVLLVGLGIRHSQPYFFMVVSETVHMYHVVPFYYGQNERRLRISFSRVKHDMLTNERKLKRRLPKDLQADENRLAKRFFRPFYNIQGYSGVFLCFPYSYFVMIGDRNIPRLHPMVVDGPVKAFAEFRNANCTAGFVYYNSRKQIQVAELEAIWNYDHNWPTRRIKVPGTVHYLSYHMDSKTYVACCAVLSPDKRIIHGSVDQVGTEVAERDPRFVCTFLPKFSIHLVMSDEWQLVPDATYALQDFEFATAMKVLPLRNGTETGMREYVVIGTNFAYGEDVQSRGRIILLDILDVVAEPDQPLSRVKQKAIYEEEQKGPVTALCGVNGYIVSAIGQKVFIWGLKGNSLVGVAFLDVQIYVHQLSSIKDLILMADVQRSVSILRFQEKYRTLSLVSSDPNQMHTYATEFCVDNQSLTVAVTDIQQDLHIFQFDPDYYFSAFGNRLVRRMECNLGQFVTNMFRLRCSAFYPDAGRVAALPLTKKHLTMFTTLDGAVGCYMNIPEKTYRRILMIETILTNHCVHRAGLSPRLYWNARTNPDQRFDLVGNIKTVADGRVGSLYLELDQTEKYEVAMKIGCSVDTLIEELLDIERQTAAF
ncbi:cleavage and polyadenylation specificity factor subunit 1-like [Paramacrobiotus metropolitanus]|uniref:cleavage and polyadenylation specificity factor subunit 1-like n=1 Tax=Paramacrobiotus metropolitanus TaxID=2943436 RepID=UPI00244624ED|nr:cleavage and polyadenylation specificity factor subunit 1-like [Paramacrobiotus metropolitanus]XP_055328375.1 cleavage and polyadenylation specificity factor subunit 1-like [Paramacrobiotus metropolitanus]